MFEKYFKYTFLIHSLLDETMPIGLTAHEIFCWSTTFSSSFGEVWHFDSFLFEPIRLGFTHLLLYYNINEPS
jgi:hypothetical protein